MKKLIFVASAVLACIIVSCGLKNNGIENVIAERDSIIAEYNSQKTELKKLTDVMDAIYMTVDSITKQEDAIYTIKESGAPNKRKELIEKLKFLGELIDRQRQTIKSLKDSLQADSVNLSPSNIKLTKVIVFLEKQLEEKDQTISKLKYEINKKNKNISKLNSTVNELKTDLSDMNEKNKLQEKALDVQDGIINEGYVLVATKKELKDLGVISSNLFKTTLNPSTFNDKNFRKVDLRDFKEISIEGKKVKILTHVPESAYLIQKYDGGIKLIITDAALFWSISNYLVIQVYK